MSDNHGQWQSRTTRVSSDDTDEDQTVREIVEVRTVRDGVITTTSFSSMAGGCDDDERRSSGMVVEQGLSPNRYQSRFAISTSDEPQIFTTIQSSSSITDDASRLRLGTRSADAANAQMQVPEDYQTRSISDVGYENSGRDEGSSCYSADSAVRRSSSPARGDALQDNAPCALCAAGDSHEGKGPLGRIVMDKSYLAHQDHLQSCAASERSLAMYGDDGAGPPAAGRRPGTADSMEMAVSSLHDQGESRVGTTRISALNPLAGSSLNFFGSGRRPNAAGASSRLMVDPDSVSQNHRLPNIVSTRSSAMDEVSADLYGNRRPATADASVSSQHARRESSRLSGAEPRRSLANDEYRTGPSGLREVATIEPQHVDKPTRKNQDVSRAGSMHSRTDNEHTVASSGVHHADTSLYVIGSGGSRGTDERNSKAHGPTGASRSVSEYSVVDDAQDHHMPRLSGVGQMVPIVAALGAGPALGRNKDIHAASTSSLQAESNDNQHGSREFQDVDIEARGESNRSQIHDENHSSVDRPLGTVRRFELVPGNSTERSPMDQLCRDPRQQTAPNVAVVDMAYRSEVGSNRMPNKDNTGAMNGGKISGDGLQMRTADDHIMSTTPGDGSRFAKVQGPGGIPAADQESPQWYKRYQAGFGGTAPDDKVRGNSTDAKYAPTIDQNPRPSKVYCNHGFRDPIKEVSTDKLDSNKGLYSRWSSISTAVSLHKEAQSPDRPPFDYGSDFNNNNNSEPDNLRDDAYHFLELYKNSSAVEMSRHATYMRRLRRIIDLRVILILSIVWTITFLNRALLNYAKIMGMTSRLGIDDDSYSDASSYFYMASLVFSFFNMWLMTKFPAAKCLAVSVIGWGICTACHAAIQNFAGLVVLRVLSGAFESGILPAMMLLTSQWFTYYEQGTRFAYWHSGMGVGEMLGGLLSYAFQHMNQDTRLSSWRTMFLVFGVITIIVGFLIIWLIPDTPMEAKFLDTEEKTSLLQHVKVNQTGISSRRFYPKQLLEGVLDVGLWILYIIVILQLVSSGITVVYSTTILVTFSYTARQAALLTIPAGAINLVTSILYGVYVRYYGKRWAVVCFASIVATVGAALLYTTPVSDPSNSILLAGLYLINFTPGSTVMIMQWMACNVAGHTKRVYAFSAMNMALAVGAIIGPQTFRAVDAPEYSRAKLITLITMAATVALVPVANACYVVMNDARDKEAVHVEGEDVEDSQAFGGLTDKQNRAFRYHI